jgi:hypothetical protein
MEMGMLGKRSYYDGILNNISSSYMNNCRGKKIALVIYSEM